MCIYCVYSVIAIWVPLKWQSKENFWNWHTLWTLKSMIFTVNKIKSKKWEKERVYIVLNLFTQSTNSASDSWPCPSSFLLNEESHMIKATIQRHLILDNCKIEKSGISASKQTFSHQLDIYHFVRCNQQNHLFPDLNQL